MSMDVDVEVSKCNGSSLSKSPQSEMSNVIRRRAATPREQTIRQSIHQSITFDMERLHSQCQLNSSLKDRSSQRNLNHCRITTKKVERNESTTWRSRLIARPSPKQPQRVSS
jgi:hypothetical protein